MASTVKSRSPAKKGQKPKRHRTPSSLVTEARTLREIKQHDEKTTKLALVRPKHSELLTILSNCRSHAKSMTLVDTPEVKISVDSKAPTPLYWDSRSAPRTYEYLATPQSMPLLATMRSLFRNKVYAIRLSTALNMSSSAAGIVNSTIMTDVVRSSTDFSALSSVFNEFFVVRFDAHWIPVSRYQYPLGGTSTLSVANLPIGCAQLHNFATAYSSLSSLSNNYAAKFHSTGDPFTYSWVNENKPSETVLSTTSVTETWADTGGSQTYGGSLQFLSQSAPPALPFSQVLGTFMTHWELMFRVRE